MPLRLLRTKGTDLQLIEVNGDRPVVKYAILSHVWRRDGEVLLEDVLNPDHAQNKPGWEKIHACREQAAAVGLDYVWIDTCCIDKSSSTELSEALNSMYKWYRDASLCLVYLHDVHTTPRETGSQEHGMPYHVEVEFRASTWFTRGWTLQEMLAPLSSRVWFYNHNWQRLTSLSACADVVARVSGVHEALLRGDKDLRSFSIAQKMSWAARRDTTRVEDRAYSLLGIFEISLPIIYGEGSRAFLRLQEELLRTTADLTLFAWQNVRMARRRSSLKQTSSNLLADSPSAFAESANIVPIPSSMRQQAYQVVGAAVEFRTYICQGLAVCWHCQGRWRRSPLDESGRGGCHVCDAKRVGTSYSGPSGHGHNLPDQMDRELVVLGCHADDLTGIVVLPVMLASHSTYFVHAHRGRRLSTIDITDVPSNAHIRTLSVWKSYVESRMEIDHAFQSTVMCRAYAPLKLVSADSHGIWDYGLQCLSIQQDKLFQAVLTIAPAEHIPGAILAIRQDPGMSTPPLAAFIHEKKSEFFLNIVFALTGSTVTFVSNGCLVSSAGMQSVLGQDVRVITVKHLLLTDTVRLVCGLSLYAASRCIIEIVKSVELPLMVFIPILLVVGVRSTSSTAYAAHRQLLDRFLLFCITPMLFLVASHMRWIRFAAESSAPDDINALLWRGFSMRRFCIHSRLWSMLALCSMYLLAHVTLRMGHISSETVQHSYDAAKHWATLGCLFHIGTCLWIMVLSPMDRGQWTGHTHVTARNSLAAVVACLCLLTAVRDRETLHPWTASTCLAKVDRLEDAVSTYFQAIAQATATPAYTICVRYASVAYILWTVIGLALLEMVMNTTEWLQNALSTRT